MRLRYNLGIFLLIIGLSWTNLFVAQGVGLVLSGGGATGMAHIGVIKVLEENEIPISYITGTSIGALIGGMYAAGYSPDEIAEYVTTDEFKKMTRLSRLSSAKKSPSERFLLREADEDASIINFSFAFDSLFTKSLPTHIGSPSMVDYVMFRDLAQVGAVLNEDFDSLFVPFRCVASDIYAKESVVYNSGDLNAAIRTSMTYPFYLNPIRIDGKLMFDGGLYNNFPVDILYRDFQVDFIIGSNVSGNDGPPQEDDILSQISTMFMKRTDYTLPCEAGIIIEPEIDVGTFEFESTEQAIEIGYTAALTYIDSIKSHVTERISVEDLNKKREKFKEKLVPVEISTIEVHSFKGSDVSFVENNFKRDSISEPLIHEDFKKYYFRTYATPQIKYVYPTLSKRKDSTFHLDLDVSKQKPFSVRFGGHFTTRSVNTGYLGISYLDLGKGAVGVNAETYFGKFYTSTKVKVDYDLPSFFPIRLSPYFTFNIWDYFKSKSSFFEDVEPSFLLQNELYYGLSSQIPITNNGRLGLDIRKFKNKDQYYQTLEYSEADTADVTNFQGEMLALNFEYNTLNRKQWASEGAMLKATFRYVQGKEQSISGNTTSNEYDLRSFHRWINLSIEGKRYFRMTPFFKIGIYGKGVFNSLSLFSNYTASLLTFSDFSPLPDAQTLFMPEYRAPQYIGGGINLIFNYKNFLELRIEPYFYQPFRSLTLHDDGTFGLSGFLKGGLPMAATSLIYHSPLGPLRFSAHYFPKQRNPVMLQLSFGYVIFNDRSIR